MNISGQNVTTSTHQQLSIVARCLPTFSGRTLTLMWRSFGAPNACANALIFLRKVLYFDSVPLFYSAYKSIVNYIHMVCGPCKTRYCRDTKDGSQTYAHSNQLVVLLASNLVFVRLKVPFFSTISFYLSSLSFNNMQFLVY